MDKDLNRYFTEEDSQGERAYFKTLHVTNHQENTNQKYTAMTHAPARTARATNRKGKCWQRRGGKEPVRGSVRQESRRAQKRSSTLSAEAA